MHQLVRVAAIGVLLAALGGSFVFYGTLEPASEYHAYPDEDDLGTADADFVGQDVDLGGTVVATDPVRIAVAHDTGTDEYVVQNAPAVDAGQELRVFATVHPDNTLEAHGAIVREPWERTYMYAISLVAAGWVGARACRHWRVDTDAVGVVPRTRGERDA